MGGVVNTVRRIAGGGTGSAGVQQAPKKTEPEGRKITTRRSRSRNSRNVGRSLISGTLPGTQTASLGQSSVRNPRDSKTNLGA